jgi:DNA-binding XRE family transcriptional regulator
MGDQRFQRHSESIGQGLAGLQHTGPAFVLDFVDSAAGESCLDTEGGLREPSDQTSLSETGSEYRLTHKSSCTRKYKHMQVHGKSALQTAVSLPGIVCAMAAKTGESDQELDGVILRLEKVREEHELSETAFAKQCGLAPNAYTKMKQRGARHAQIETVQKICAGFGLNPGWVLLGKGPRLLEAIDESADLVTENDTRISALSSWARCLPIAQALSPEIDPVFFDAVGESKALLVEPLTPAIIIDFAKVVMRHQDKERLRTWLNERRALRGS